MTDHVTESRTLVNYNDMAWKISWCNIWLTKLQIILQLTLWGLETPKRQWRPRWNATKCGISSGSTLIAYRQNWATDKKIQYFLKIIAWAPSINGPWRKKTCLRGLGITKVQTSLAHPRSLISTLVIRFLESNICQLALSQTKKKI